MLTATANIGGLSFNANENPTPAITRTMFDAATQSRRFDKSSMTVGTVSRVANVTAATMIRLFDAWGRSHPRMFQLTANGDETSHHGSPQRVASSRVSASIATHHGIDLSHSDQLPGREGVTPTGSSPRIVRALARSCSSKPSVNVS
jgi:hypothetical protein